MTARNRHFSPTRLAQRALACLVLSGSLVSFAFAGDTTYGTIIEVKSLDVVVLDTGTDKYTVRLIGIVAPNDPALAKKGKQMVATLILNKWVQMRFDHRNGKDEMVSRILTIQTEKVDAKDTGEILVKAGLAKREADFDYKCGCLTNAENEARAAKRGLWSAK